MRRLDLPICSIPSERLLEIQKRIISLQHRIQRPAETGVLFRDFWLYFPFLSSIIRPFPFQEILLEGSKDSPEEVFVIMTKEDFSRSLKKLESDDPKVVNEGVYALGKLIKQLKGTDLKIALGGLYSLFYIDFFDRPEFSAVVDAAIDIMALRPEETTSFLLSRAGDSDLKAGMRISLAFGKIGASCVDELVEKLRSTRDHYTKTLILYSFGKIKDSSVKRVITDVMDAFRDESKEVRDSAARAVGKIVEVVPPLDIPVSERNRLLNGLLHLLRDPFPGVRSKAIRSLGKMAAFNYIGDEDKMKTKDILKRLTGQNIHYRWDNAYIVRREAELAIAKM